MKSRSITTLFVLIIPLFLAVPVLAQDDGISLKLSRDFGYSSGTGDIQGLFSMKVTGPEDLVLVRFYIDETLIGEAMEAPFRIQFSTDDYSFGLHTMYAIGFTADGQEFQSRVLTGNFVSADEGWDAAGKIILPMGGIVLLVILLAVGLPAFLTRGKLEKLPLGEERHYGIHGGGICPKCHRPFVMHLWGMNLGLSRYDRCPYCGKWSVVRIQTLAKLKEAEKAELAWDQAQVPMASDQEKFAKDLDDSKYQG